MLSADRGQLVQTTNQAMVDFRRQELNYFISIYSNFGFQCAFLAGFTINSLVQVPVLAPGTPISMKWLYCLSTAGTFVLSINVIVSTGAICVFGQGLAIRGPIGSLSVAIEGMMAERKQIMRCFTGSFIVFGLQICGIYWIQMYRSAAFLSSAFSLVGFYYWYKYTMRAFNRFDFDYDPLASKKATSDDPNMREESGLMVPLVRSLNTVRERVEGNKEKQEEKSRSRANTFFSVGLERKERESLNVPKVAGQKMPLEVIMYDSMITFKLSKNSFSQMQEEHPDLSGEREGKYVWFRCYAVLNDNLIYLYKDKFSFQNGGNPLRKRPLDIEGFSIDSIEYGRSQSDNKSDFRRHEDDEGSVPALRMVPLDPEDDRYSLCFKYDNLNERDAWLEILNEALKKSDREAEKMEKNYGR